MEQARAKRILIAFSQLTQLICYKTAKLFNASHQRKQEFTLE